MTFQEAQRAAAVELARAGVPSPENDAALLLMYVCGWNRTQYLLMMREEMSENTLAAYQAVIAQRKKRIPLQHITGTAPFMGYTFRVSPDVLIPRPDTEMLVQRAGEYLSRQTDDGGSVLDLCCGSGCIAVTLKKTFPHLQVTASDISGAALQVAKENADRLGAQIKWVRSDLFASIKGKFDLIVSNPPYIPSGEIAELEDEVRLYDPVLALDGGEDGLRFYREIASAAGNYLHKGGYLMLEIGAAQADDVSGILQAAGFRAIKIYRDLAGLDRVAAGGWL